MPCFVLRLFGEEGQVEPRSLVGLLAHAFALRPSAFLPPRGGGRRHGWRRSARRFSLARRHRLDRSVAKAAGSDRGQDGCMERAAEVQRKKTMANATLHSARGRHIVLFVVPIFLRGRIFFLIRQNESSESAREELLQYRGLLVGSCTTWRDLYSVSG